MHQLVFFSALKTDEMTFLFQERGIQAASRGSGGSHAGSDLIIYLSPATSISPQAFPLNYIPQPRLWFFIYHSFPRSTSFSLQSSISSATQQMHHVLVTTHDLLHTAQQSLTTHQQMKQQQEQASDAMGGLLWQARQASQQLAVLRAQHRAMEGLVSDAAVQAERNAARLYTGMQEMMKMQREEESRRRDGVEEVKKRREEERVELERQLKLLTELSSMVERQREEEHTWHMKIGEEQGKVLGGQQQLQVRLREIGREQEFAGERLRQSLGVLQQHVQQHQRSVGTWQASMRAAQEEMLTRQEHAVEVASHAAEEALRHHESAEKFHSTIGMTQQELLMKTQQILKVQVRSSL